MLVALPNIIRQFRRIVDVDGSNANANANANSYANYIGNDDDTVQVSQTTSFLGMHLLEGDWTGYSDDDRVGGHDDHDHDHDLRELAGEELDFRPGCNCKDLLEYLATPEGRADVASANDPLGLFPNESYFAGLLDDVAEKLSHKMGIVSSSRGDGSDKPRNCKCHNHYGHKHKSRSSRRSAFFAGLFVRAPFPVMEAIYNIEKETFLHDPATSSSDCHDHDLSSISETDWWIECFMCLLAVIPTKDEERLSNSTSPTASGSNGAVLYRTRTWSVPEFESLILMLLNDYPSPGFSEIESGSEWKSKSEYHSDPSSTLLRMSPKWIINAPSVVSLTPLAIAAYNPDISPAILRLLHRLEPRAIRKECTLFGVHTIPLHVAAASPLPSKQTVSLSCYNEAKERRWKKIETLVVLSEIQNNNSANVVNFDGNGETNLTTQPTMKQIQQTCREAIEREEWELVRELLKRYDQHHQRHQDHWSNSPRPFSKVAVVLTETRNNHLKQYIRDHYHRHPIPQLENVHNALLKHDTEVEIKTMQYRIAKEREERERSLRKNHVLVLDALRSVWTVFASSWRREGDGTTIGTGRVVDPMS
ncbi:hypothetical protein ACHAXS_002470 [Conticribra weissflogii]